MKALKLLYLIKGAINYIVLRGKGKYKTEYDDVIKPKFKIGQTIKREDYGTFTIVKIKDGYYSDGISTYIPIYSQDEWELVE